jgi:hypothetical protein
MRRKTANSPPGKTFATPAAGRVAHPAADPTKLSTLEWLGQISP